MTPTTIAARRMVQDCVTSCPRHNNAPWDVLIVAACLLGFLALSASIAAVANWRARIRSSSGSP